MNIEHLIPRAPSGPGIASVQPVSQAMIYAFFPSEIGSTERGGQIWPASMVGGVRFCIQEICHLLYDPVRIEWYLD